MSGTDAPDWQRVVTTVASQGAVTDAPDWQRVVVGPGGVPAGGFSNPMTTEGDIIVGGTSGAAERLGAGTAADVLTSNGPGTLPSWAKAPASLSTIYYATGNSQQVLSPGHSTQIISFGAAPFDGAAFVIVVARFWTNGGTTGGVSWIDLSFSGGATSPAALQGFSSPLTYNGSTNVPGLAYFSGYVYDLVKNTTQMYAVAANDSSSANSVIVNKSSDTNPSVGYFWQVN